MKCRAGYKPDSPLCAVCDVGYYRQLFDCFECQEVRWGEFSGFLITMLALALFVCWLIHKYGRLLELSMATAMAHVKIIISFVVVLLSVDVQFGVAWPPVFARMLDALGVFTFDFGVLTGVFCLASFGACAYGNTGWRGRGYTWMRGMGSVGH